MPAGLARSREAPAGPFRPASVRAKRREGIDYDHVPASLAATAVEPGDLDYAKRSERRKIHKLVYGDSWWVDLDVIEGEASELMERDHAALLIARRRTFGFTS